MGRLEFRLLEVKCLKETDGWGSDDIMLGAVFVESDYEVKVVPAFEVKDFDEGERRTWDPPHVLVSMPIRKKYPENFTVTLVLIEEDGRSEVKAFFSQLAKKTEDEAKKMKLRAERAAASLGRGSARGTKADLVDAINEGLKVIPKIAKTAYDVFDLFSGGGDDFFPPTVLNNVIRNDREGDRAAEVIRFEAHGGRYEVRADWRRVSS